MNQEHIEKRTFPVLGMSCAACAARVDKTLNGQPGVRTASVNYAAARLPWNTTRHNAAPNN